ncbi:protein-glutamine gamma-glutamyltransferase 2-like isoform X1 [Scyliorhinus canicula]|uniref:protein-glutamine gamma-glutamyltransferase 2-like isoform X1 n=2 Tax=Scyliorhinus canicula TaxID=7830 RepID=UPI0018F29E69|nr:protein-glutamine gamma-glutamyltransferase 2-like isoform X1 [Scyliorhinus canicula]
MIVAEMNFSVDFQCEVNNQNHKTAEIGTNRLIIRRGQLFYIILQSYTDEYIDHNTIVLTAKTGVKPSTSSGTEVMFSVNSLSANGWKAFVSSSTGTRLTLAISSSPNAKIGRYSLHLLTTKEFKSSKIGEFILLFNPWCTEDDVFLDSDEQREEYVLNEDGVIFVGTNQSIQSRSWYFGQFEDKIIDICLTLLDKNLKCQECPRKDYIRRNDPAYISRVVTAMVNCCDDSGVLQGKWQSPYTGGTCPWHWNGSVAILHQWDKSGSQRVQFGQCWVFAAVACTVLRCLGIPTRVVTNFNSAHDSNGNLTIDEFFDERGRKCGGGGDSVWNFHVWIESWMARNDLKPGYGGWQVLDPTPQEKSEGVYCCGPAPVTAIKDGSVDMKYDVPFVFAEVNADQVCWLLHRDGTKEKLSIETQHVGQNISTKCCGRNDRDDITQNYKYPEGSDKERAIVSEADLINRLGRVPEKKLQLHMKAEKSINNGSDAQVHVTISNLSSSNMVCNLNFSAHVKSYNGNLVNQITEKDLERIAVRANGDETMTLVVPYSDYGNYLGHHHLIKLTASVVDIVTKKMALAVNDLSVINPEITIQIRGDPVIHLPLMAEIQYTNTLRVPLNHCVFTVEGTYLICGMKTFKINRIDANQTIKMPVEFIPSKAGPRKLMVDFDCKEMTDVKGFKNITVQCFKL